MSQSHYTDYTKSVQSIASLELQYITRHWDGARMKNWDAQAAGADSWHRGNKHIKRICKCYELWGNSVWNSEFKWKSPIPNLDLNKLCNQGVNMCSGSLRKRISSHIRNKCVVFLCNYFRTRLPPNTLCRKYCLFISLCLFAVFKLVFANDDYNPV